ncbi:MAG: Fe-S cluster assembly protein SufD [Gemmatimonadetes bacterium]|nr:Fe-S cluster assembly protein SufD [Gemmatimonadota bacterium]
MTESLKQATPSRYTAFYDTFDRIRSLDAPLWLHRIRSDAMKRFRALGMPVAREVSFPLREDWIYTDLRTIADTSYHAEPAESELDEDALAPYEFGENDWHRLVFVNGAYSSVLSREHDLPHGVVVRSLADALVEHPELVHPHLARHADYEGAGLTALNTALFENGLFVYVPRGGLLETPVHVHYVTTGFETPTATQPRTLIVAGDGANLKVVESYSGMTDQAYLTNAVTEISVGRDGHVDHYRINREGAGAAHLSTTQLHLEGNGRISTFNMSMGGALTRNDTNARLAGEHAVVRMNGLFLVTGNQHVDNHTAIDHAVPNCDSYEVYKGILDGRSRGVFNGKVFVHQDAQETDAKQLNKNLMLSADAMIHTKPQLEIYADQVKCTHGATVGQLDEDQIFYLRTRGLSHDSACHLLTYGFAADLIRRLRIDAVRSSLDTLFETTIRNLSTAQGQAGR